MHPLIKKTIRSIQIDTYPGYYRYPGNYPTFRFDENTRYYNIASKLTKNL